MTAVDDARAAAPPHAAGPVAAPRAGGHRIERACDALLDLGVLAFAAWTLSYDVCLVLGVGVDWAAAAGLAALGGAAWVICRPADGTAPARRGSFTARRGSTRLAAAAVGLAVAGAAAFAFTAAAWWLVWPLWLGAALAGAGAARSRAGEPGLGRGGAAVALPWAAALAALSLVLTRTDGDDAQYVRLASWIGAHGRFPLRDTLFSDERLPAIFFPPLSSYEPLVGTVAHLTGVAAASVVYFAVPPVASALGVLALWRLLRAWGVQRVGVALSAALLFLLWDGAEFKSLGDLFVGRIWQGKVVFAALLVPLLLALAHEYAERPSRRGLALLAAAGTAGVGLTTTAVFVLPVIAVGALAAATRGSARVAGAGFAATMAYPAGAAALSLAAGTRNAQSYVDAQVAPAWLTHLVFGHGVLAAAAVTAMLAGAVAIRRAHAARMVAATSLVVVCVFAPGVPPAIFHLTDLGQILWRVTWAVPVAALVGAAVSGGRVLPAALLVAGLLAWGVPVWDAPGSLGFAAPAYKRTPETLAGARQILAVARPGDVVLAPPLTSETVLVLSGDVYTVASRPFYATALAGVPGGNAPERLQLLAFTQRGLDDPDVDPARVRAALRVLDVAVACLAPGHDRALAVLRSAGYAPASRTARLTCLRAR